MSNSRTAARHKWRRRAAIARNRDKRKEGRNGRAGYVYVVALGFDDLYKIGWAGNWSNRLSALRAANPRAQVVVARRVPNARHAESHLHRRYRGQCLEREIFSLRQDDIKAIEDYLTSRQPKIEDCLLPIMEYT